MSAAVLNLTVEQNASFEGVLTLSDIPILIKAIQEQQEMIDKLRAKVFA
jgi:hypothetical protein